jgi:hypothetical protein
VAVALGVGVEVGLGVGVGVATQQQQQTRPSVQSRTPTLTQEELRQPLTRPPYQQDIVL